MSHKKKKCSLFCLQIRALLRPVEPDDGSTSSTRSPSSSHHSSSSQSSRSRSTSEDSTDLRPAPNHPQQPQHPQQHLQNGVILLDPVLCSKNFDMIRNENVLIDDTLKQHHSVCGTVAEVTENLSVSQVELRDSVESSSDLNCSNNAYINNVCQTNENSSIPNGGDVTVFENCNAVNGHVSNGDVKVHVTPDEVNCAIQSSDKELSETYVSDGNVNTTSIGVEHAQENGDTSSFDEEIHGNNVFLKLVNDEALILTAEREYLLTLLDDAYSVSEEGKFYLVVF